MQHRTKKIYKKESFFYGVLLLWLTVNIVQAAVTGLLNDEAYYWFYGQNLDWGYYDHPPLIAFVIKIGEILFPGYLGVRIVVVFLSAGIILLLKVLTRPNDYLLFAVFFFSVFIFQSVGFIAVPDTVFIFFVILFLYAYKHYLKNESAGNILLLLLAVTGMFYSKYFAFPVVMFTVLSNISLIKKRSFWIILFGVTVLLIPHLLWQIKHDFVTIYFHLKERNVNADFALSNIFGFIGGQLLLLNPLTVYFIVKYFFKGEVRDKFDRAMVFNVVGFFTLAFFLSFFKRIEANWTVAAMAPLLIFSYKSLQKSNFNRKVFYFLAATGMLLILLVRINIAFNLSATKGPKILRQFLGWQTAAKDIAETAQGRPVVFSCSYQNASQYIFHTGRQAFTFNNLFYRKNQFDLAGIEPRLQGKEVIFIKDTKYLDDHYKKPFEMPEPDSILLFGKWWYYKNIERYYSYNFLNVKLGLEKHKFKAGSTITVPVDLINPLDSVINISPGVDSYLTVCFAVKNRPYQYTEVEKITGLRLKKSYHTQLTVKVPEKSGKYFLWVSVQTGWLSPAINHRVFKVKVVE